MRTTKRPQSIRKQTEKSWVSRHLGSIVFLSLVFSSVVYAISWPTVPGESGYPVEWSFWNYFQSILVDTGASTDGTVKKSETLGKYRGRTAIIADANGNIWVGTGAETGYAMSISGQALFNDTVTGTPPTASWHLATKGYVDGVVIAAWGGGGYGQCYRIKTGTSAYPSCAAGYTRTYASYGDHVGSTTITNRIYFENNIGGAWFQNFGHVYLYYTYDNGSNLFTLYDDQDVWLSNWFFGSEPAISSTFSSKKSTFMSYTTASPTTFNTPWNYIGDFWYAVCCK